MLVQAGLCGGPVRKPHCWFSHEAAHLNLKDEKYQKREKYDPRHDKTEKRTALCLLNSDNTISPHIWSEILSFSLFL